MPASTSSSLRDRLVVLAVVVVALLVAPFGMHLLELWLAHIPAAVISHGLALVLLVVAYQQWRARRTRRMAGV
jgi:hypothetical protein